MFEGYTDSFNNPEKNTVTKVCGIRPRVVTKLPPSLLVLLDVNKSISFHTRCVMSSYMPLPKDSYNGLNGTILSVELYLSSLLWLPDVA